MGRKNNDNGTKLEDLSDDSDNEDVDINQLEILNNILNIKNKNPKEYNTIKFVLFATALFIVLSLPFTDRLLELAIPAASSWLILICMKTILFFVGYYIIVYANK